MSALTTMQTLTVTKAPHPQCTPSRVLKNPRPLCNKDAVCRNCGEPPPQGTQHRACSGCKTVVYCSKECQKANWTNHRGRCQNVQFLRLPQATELVPRWTQYARSQSVDASWPMSMSTRDRAVLLNNFLELHHTNLILSIALLENALRRQRLVIDVHKHELVLTVGYRGKSGGNPATQLVFKKVEVMRRGEGGRCVDLPHEAQQGSMNVVLRGGGAYGNFWAGSARELTPGEVAMLDAWPMTWIEHLRLTTTVGMFFEVRDTQPTVAFVMRKEGKKWKRTKVTDEEMVQFCEERERHLGPDVEVDMSLLSDSPQSH